MDIIYVADSTPHERQLSWSQNCCKRNNNSVFFFFFFPAARALGQALPQILFIYLRKAFKVPFKWRFGIQVNRSAVQKHLDKFMRPLVHKWIQKDHAWMCPPSSVTQQAQGEQTTEKSRALLYHNNLSTCRCCRPDPLLDGFCSHPVGHFLHSSDSLKFKKEGELIKGDGFSSYSQTSLWSCV